tara:strand:+ start:3271 stop:3816 length:546 start_codon:yes stop_codon:yes gene_type:complete
MAKRKYTAGAGQKFMQKRQLSSPSMFLQLLKKSMLGKNLGGEMSLKKIPEGPKGEGLRKLKAERPDVTKKMGFAKKGKMAKANKGMSVKGDNPRDIRKVEDKIGASRSSKREKGRMTKARTGKMIYANVGVAAQKVREKEMMKASMGKSVRGFGAARTSGMGLQDESLPPGKSLDYYKDLM